MTVLFSSREKPGVARRILCATVLWLACAVLLSAQDSPEADRELVALLNKTGLRYGLMNTGGVRLQFSLENGRTHQVIIKRERNTIGNLQLWEAVTFAWKGTHRPSAQISHRILADNSQKKIGAWELVSRDDTEYYLVFNVKIPVSCDPVSLKAILLAAAFGADRMEADIAEGDEF